MKQLPPRPRKANRISRIPQCWAGDYSHCTPDDLSPPLTVDTTIWDACQESFQEEMAENRERAYRAGTLPQFWNGHE
jgi:hypothetical protein